MCGCGVELCNWLSGCPCCTAPCGKFWAEFITAAQRGSRSCSTNEERWGEMKTLRASSSGTQASKAAWQFQSFFLSFFYILDAELGISEEYPPLKLENNAELGGQFSLT